MGKSKKAFIDRKNALTFHLVHRSQHDPLVVDDTAPQRVLVEAVSQKHTKTSTDPVDPAKRQEEQQKFGIFFDDDYDYLQHMKKPEQEVVWEYVENPNHARKRIEEGRVTTAPKLALPSSVFASEFEEDEGMLNRAAVVPGPRPDWDPDVVAALDEDFDFDNEDNLLEDDFVLKAMAEGDDEDEDNDEDELSDVEEDDQEDFDSDDLNETDDQELMDRLGPLLRERRFDDEETKSRFTEYSMSSSVIRRNEQLTLLDDRFEHFYATYDDPELGDLACEEIEGDWDQKHRVLMACYREHKRGKKVEAYNKEWDRERVERYRNIAEGEEDPNDELVEMEMNDDKQKKWDCESVLSTYSNIYNHPKLIEEPTRRSRRSSKADSNEGVNKIEIDPKTGLPTNVLRNGDNNQLTEKALSKLDKGMISNGPKSLCNKSLISTLSVLSIRPKDEAPEEKRERKRLLKEYRMERRIERKANAQAFKEEKKRQTHVKINQNCNQQGKQIV
ncbi:PREDICTED: protein LTV1 homolog [Rhagoletis zephyria]|uniref:protein LTV1 homolog n=1 Tax=Rhagoletis zephyria TaxID=28612 RepID=UPI00081159D3|nr:PREDICTED: protein LTV1 homolog [Rhagoletis zephyria]